MTSPAEIAQGIIAQMPPQTRFSSTDVQTFVKHKDLMNSWEPDIVQGFYNTVYGHDATKAIFKDGERPTREESLADWWKRTVGTPIDDSYWSWMTLVGLLHVVRGVKNPMMLSMCDFIVTAIEGKARAALSDSDATELVGAWTRLTATIGALISESYLEYYLRAIGTASGMARPLMENLVGSEIDQMLSEIRGR